MNTQAIKSLPTTLGNAGYNAAIVTGLAITYNKAAHMLMKKSPPATLNKLDSGAIVSIVCIGLSLVTRDYLVASGIIPTTILK